MRCLSFAGCLRPSYALAASGTFFAFTSRFLQIFFRQYPYVRVGRIAASRRKLQPLHIRSRLLASVIREFLGIVVTRLFDILCAGRDVMQDRKSVVSGKSV